MAAGGCRKAAFYTGIGCLVVVLGIALLITVGLYKARAAFKEHGASRPETTSFSIPVGGSAAAAGQAAGGAGTEGGGIVPGQDLLQPPPAPDIRPVRLTLDLAEGEFTIRPGPAGSELQVEGTFDPRDYELTQETEDLGDAGRSVRVKFRRKGFFFLFFNHDRDRVRIAVTIPREVPTDLTMKLARCQSDVDLGGLTLTGLEGDLSMGQHEIGFSEPIAGELGTSRIRSSMGELKLSGLGNARPKDLGLSGSMGEFRIDLDGAWPPGFSSRIQVRHSMGDMRIHIPPGVRYADTSTSRISLGEVRKTLDAETPLDPNAPVVELNVSGSMGEIRIVQD